MTGLMKVIDMLGTHIAGLEAENVRLKAIIEAQAKREEDPGAR